ncbi:response regulator [Sediminibacterium soli]|uniref:response regulator n=1 Tax=Sediminibacterium soli TaxID=2698829 RepID=UPI00137B68D3|nr:response regulator [Sediminibacterium soli]NCI45907.1 response regulator [Sediminibacterium soli]
MEKKVRIFLVDDDTDDRSLFMDALSEIDTAIELATAINGTEALEKMLAMPGRLPDYIFMDLNMPLMNGLQCLKELKKRAALAHIPVIIYSTSSHSKDKEEAARSGAFDYIVKPFSFTELCASIRKVLQQ